VVNFGAFEERFGMSVYHREFARVSEAELILPVSVAPLISCSPFTFFLSARINVSAGESAGN